MPPRTTFPLICLFFQLCFFSSAWSQSPDWFWQNPLPQANTLRAVDFVNATTGTAVGVAGTILRTTDGGSSWVIQTSGTTNILNAVSFTDATTGTAVGGPPSFRASFGTILRTTDGGSSWVRQTSGTTNRTYGVSFTDAMTGTVVGDGGTILRTTTGGVR